MFVSLLIPLFFSLFFTTATSYTLEADADKIIGLPGLSDSSAFNQFSGYITLAETQKHIHYWLVEAVVLSGL